MHPVSQDDKDPPAPRAAERPEEASSRLIAPESAPPGCLESWSLRDVPPLRQTPRGF
jgi:hypothetical protein